MSVRLFRLGTLRNKPVLYFKSSKLFNLSRKPFRSYYTSFQTFKTKDQEIQDEKAKANPTLASEAEIETEAKRLNYETVMLDSSAPPVTIADTPIGTTSKVVDDPLPPPPPASYSQVSRELKKGLGRNLAVLGVLGVLLASYLLENNEKPTNKVGAATKMLESDNPDIQKEGFAELEKNLFVTRRVFSGTTTRRTDIETVAQPRIINALVKCIDSSDPEISSNALSWLYWLTKGNHNARDLILEHLPQIVKKATSEIDPQKHEWIIAAFLIGNLLQDREGKKALKRSNSLALVIDSLQGSPNPLALLVAQNLRDRLNGTLSPSQERLIDVFINPLVPPSHTNADFTSTALFGLFASLWGKWRWKRVVAQYKTRFSKEQLKSFMRNRPVGTGVLFLLVLDLFLQEVLRKSASTSHLALIFPDHPIKFFEHYPKLYNFPMTHAFSIFENTLFALGTIALIYSQKYVVLPLFLAGSYYHIESLLEIEQVREFVNTAKVQIPKLLGIDHLVSSPISKTLFSKHVVTGFENVNDKRSESDKGHMAEMTDKGLIEILEHPPSKKPDH
eukprot:TRINITY_DN1463_c0_g1_i1.p1 TRINITY_DN1463_c0_g1~~TRINITY_DN1463_c0_g1_i1.p1  ORF type:complete len:561 (-),score=81.11 TRINITY_DN1463_c0_g1_i1:35-1717(-)